MAASIGTIVAKLGLDPSQLLAGVNSAKSALQSAAKGMGDLETATASAFRTIQASDLGKNIRQLASDCAEAAARADDLRDGLNGAFRDTAPDVANYIEALGTANGVLSDADLAQAAKTLQNFGTYSEENLAKIADAAAATGKPVESLAEAFGKFQKLGDSKSIKALQKAFGASAKDLQDFGAVLDKDGNILADTPARVDAARAALEKFSEVKFGGALDRVSDDSAKLTGELELLKRELGASTFALKEQLDSALLPYVQGLREASPEVKGFVGATIEIASGAGSAIPQLVSMAAQLKILGVTFSAAAAGTAALVAILASAAIGLGIYTNQLEKTNKAEEDFLQSQEKAARALRDNKNLIGLSAEQIKGMGKSTKDLIPVFQGLQDQLRASRDVDPNSAKTKSLEKQVRDLAKVKNDLAKLEEATRKPEATSGRVEVSVKEQNAANERARKEKKANDDKDTRDRKTAAENARKEALDIALDEIKRKSAAREIDKNQEIALLQDVLKAKKTTASEERDIQQQIANLTGQIRDKAASDEQKKSEDQKRNAEKNAEQLRSVKKAGLDQQIKDADAALKELDQKEREGADVSLARQKELAKKLAAEKAKVDLQAEADRQKTTDGNVKAQVTKQAGSSKAALERENNAELDRLSKERKDSELQDRKEELDFSLEIQRKKIDSLKELSAAGQDSTQQIKSALQQQLEIQLQLIEAQRQQTLAATTDPGKIAIANKRAEVQIQEARAATRKEIEATTAAIRAQKDESKSPLDFGSIKSLDQFIKDSQGFLDLTKQQPAAGGQDLKSIADQQRLQQILNEQPALSQSLNGAQGGIPKPAPGQFGQPAGAGAAPVQSIQTKTENNTFNGTSVSDPALKSLIVDTFNQLQKAQNFKTGGG